MNKLTKEICLEEALKFDNRIDFKKYSNKAFNFATKHKFIHDICVHMKKKNNLSYRCIYVYEFSDNYAYIGLTYNIEKRNNTRKLNISDPVTKHINETKLVPNLKQLSEYILVNIATILEDDTISYYKDNGWNILNKARGGGIGSTNKIWSKEKCLIEALKYNTRSEFYYNSNKIYSAACRNKWLNDICKHMYYKHKSWTLEDCIELARKYENKYDFYKNNCAAYTWAKRKGILNIVCSYINKN